MEASALPRHGRTISPAASGTRPVRVRLRVRAPRHGGTPRRPCAVAGVAEQRLCRLNATRTASAVRA